jgi:hypothetical protein
MEVSQPDLPPVAPGKPPSTTGAPRSKKGRVEPSGDSTKADTKASSKQQPPDAVWAMHAQCPTKYDAAVYKPKQGWDRDSASWAWRTCVLKMGDKTKALCLYCPKVHARPIPNERANSLLLQGCLPALGFTLLTLEGKKESCQSTKGLTPSTSLPSRIATNVKSS